MDARPGETLENKEPILRHTVSRVEKQTARQRDKGIIAVARHLVADIGPRPPGSPQESAALRLVEKELSSLGLEAESRKFLAPATTAWSETLDHLALILGVLLYPVNSHASFALVFLGYLFFLLEQYGRSPFMRLQPHRRSGNVAARIKPYREAKRKLVLLAHVDSPRSAFYYRPGLVRLFRPFLLLDFLSQTLLFMLMTVAYGGYLLSMDKTTLDLMWKVGLLLCIPAAAALVALLMKAAAGKTTPGGNQNASGVAVLLELARVYARRQPYETELWIVATGASDASGLGARRFASGHRRELRGCFFIVLDGVGRGVPVCFRREGRLFPFRANRKLTSIAGRVFADQAHYAAGFGNNRLWLSEGFQLLSRGRKAMTVSSREESRYPRYWRWHKDDYDNIDPRSLRLSVEFMRALVDAFDRGDLSGK